METSLVSSSSEVWWEMIFNINLLSHIFKSSSDSTVSIPVIWSLIWSKLHPWAKVLILRSWTLSLYNIKIELIFVRCSTDASLVNLTNILGCIMSMLLHFLLWVPKLCKLPVLNIHRLRLWSSRILIRWKYLSIISSSLWSSLYLVLNLCLLLFVWISNLNSLTYLLIMWSIKRSHLLRMLLSRRFRWWTMVYIRITFLSWVLSISSLCC